MVLLLVAVPVALTSGGTAVALEVLLLLPAARLADADGDGFRDGVGTAGVPDRVTSQDPYGCSATVGSRNPVMAALRSHGLS